MKISPSAEPVIGVRCNNPEQFSRSVVLAETLSVPHFSDEQPPSEIESGFLVEFNPDGVRLRPMWKGAPNPLQVSFDSGKNAHRRQYGGGSGQSLAKATGLAQRRDLTILDATAGLARDGFVMASLGAKVILCERSPVVAELVVDGLRRGLLVAKDRGDQDLVDILSRMQFLQMDARTALAGESSPIDAPDVIYLDPMFPESSKSALVKKDMALFHRLLGDDDLGDCLLQPALDLAVYRVIVKRPRKAPPLDNCPPSFELTGKSGRFDIYTKRKLR